eukprot:9493320-Pyramimonas_sp.AAC.1
MDCCSARSPSEGVKPPWWRDAFVARYAAHARRVPSAKCRSFLWSSWTPSHHGRNHSSAEE